MLWDLVVFALIGLLAGAAARLFYPRREPMKVLGTLVLGMVGSLLGGLISWAFWPPVDGVFNGGALLTSLTGAAAMLVFWAGVAYARSISVPDRPAR
jgi:uncharacterized membrane protein YeaQ/YmgE (transglycosylase-associated protein family)